MGYQVTTFESALTFLDSDVSIKQSECVITDIMMPGVDGIELYRRLSDAGLRIPLIFFTALTDASTTARIRRCRVHGILTKPCTEQTLIRCINAALEFHRSPAACGLVPS
jgi:FixJ family two-component response regulator